MGTVWTEIFCVCSYAAVLYAGLYRWELAWVRHFLFSLETFADTSHHSCSVFPTCPSRSLVLLIGYIRSRLLAMDSTAHPARGYLLLPVFWCNLRDKGREGDDVQEKECVMS